MPLRIPSLPCQRSALLCHCPAILRFGLPCPCPAILCHAMPAPCVWSPCHTLASLCSTMPWHCVAMPLIRHAYHRFATPCLCAAPQSVQCPAELCLCNAMLDFARAMVSVSMPRPRCALRCRRAAVPGNAFASQVNAVQCRSRSTQGYALPQPLRSAVIWSSGSASWRTPRPFHLNVPLPLLRHWPMPFLSP